MPISCSFVYTFILHISQIESSVGSCKHGSTNEATCSCLTIVESFSSTCVVVSSSFETFSSSPHAASASTIPAAANKCANFFIVVNSFLTINLSINNFAKKLWNKLKVVVKCLGKFFERFMSIFSLTVYCSILRFISLEAGGDLRTSRQNKNHLNIWVFRWF